MVAGSDTSVNQVAQDMGIHPNTLYRWVKQFSEKPEAAFLGNGHLVSSEAETIRQLKRENERLKMERDILKKPWPSFPATRSDFSVYEQSSIGISDFSDV